MWAVAVAPDLEGGRKLCVWLVWVASGWLLAALPIGCWAAVALVLACSGGGLGRERARYIRASALQVRSRFGCLQGSCLDVGSGEASEAACP